MQLQCLLVTRQHDLLELVRPALTSFNIDIEVRTEAESAAEFAERRHLDGFLIDCDDVPGAPDLLERIRASRSNKLSTIFAIVNGVTSVDTALGRGANFVLGKPIAKERFYEYLKIARTFMEREHRRYFRYKVCIPMQAESEDQQQFEGRVVNISEGGASVFAPSMIRYRCVVRLSLELPTVSPHKLEAKGEIVWSDDSGKVGVRFLYLPEASRQMLHNWLSMLHAQVELQSQQEPATGANAEPV